MTHGLIVEGPRARTGARLEEFNRIARRATPQMLAEYQRKTAYSGPTQIGQTTTSSIREVADIPSSFEQLASGNENWTIGIAGTVKGASIDADRGLVSLLMRDTQRIWDPKVNNEQSRAIGEIVALAIQDYRRIHKFAGPLQVYGQIKKYDDKVVTKQNVHSEIKKSPYTDLVPHLDFVPANIPASVYFATNINPTIAFEGPYVYKGYLKTKYSTDRGGLKESPMKGGKISVSDHPDTLLHSAHKETEGKRVFIRIYVGPELHLLAETQQLVNDALPLRGSINAVLEDTPSVRIHLRHDGTI